jgi:hypothetical protein
VELKIASPPMSAMRTKKEGCEGFKEPAFLLLLSRNTARLLGNRAYAANSGNSNLIRV